MFLQDEEVAAAEAQQKAEELNQDETEEVSFNFRNQIFLAK